MKRYFKIGDFTFCIDSISDICFPENFLLFETDETITDYSYKFMVTDTLPAVEGELTASREDIQIYFKDQLEIRYIARKGYDNSTYACYKEISEHSAEIYMLEREADELRYDTLFNSLFALEKRMVSYNSMILHCAYMRYNNQAILFSAPSGVGKSTQAGLWNQYRGNETINGDRALLSYKDGWYANGWPVCGSSEICNNISLPVKCIVLLGQAKVNTIKRMHPMAAFSKIYTQITVNKWNREDHNKIMDMIEKLVMDIPVYYLECDISEDSVKCLESVLD